MFGLTKRLSVVACLAFVAGCGSASAPESTPDIIGVWRGTDQVGQIMECTFNPQGRLTVKISGANGSFNKRGTYKVDLSQDPAHLDIKLDDREEIHTILDHIDDKHLAFENINSSEERPTKFGDRKIVFKRQ